MATFPSKILAVFLAFLLLTFAPLIIVSLVQDIRTERITWNALTDYTDIVTDKGVLTENDYREFVAKLGSTGLDFEVSVLAKNKMVMPDGSGNFTIKYVSSGLWKSSTGGILNNVYLEAGDSIQVIIKPLSQTRASALLQGVLKLHTNNTEYSYAATVRNDGDLYV